MVDAVSEIKGFNSGLPDWEKDQLVADDPVMYREFIRGDDLIVGGSWREPHTLRGVASHDLGHGMHEITVASLSGYRTKGEDDV